MEHPTEDAEDIFEWTFHALRQSLKALQANKLIPINDRNEMGEDHLMEKVWKNIQSVEYKNLEKIQDQSHLIDQQYRHLISLQAQSLEQVESSVHRMLSSCNQQLHVASLRLSQQFSVSERRLQDLLMEVLGEYGKTLTRSRRRENYIVNTCHMEMIMTTWIFMWKKFCARLRFDLLNVYRSQKISIGDINCQSVQNMRSKLNITTICKQADQLEFCHILKYLNKKIGLVCDQDYVPYSIIKVSKNSIRVLNNDQQSRGNKGNFNNNVKENLYFQSQTVKIAHYKKDLMIFFNDIYNWVFGNRICESPSRSVPTSYPTLTSRKGSLWKEILSNSSFAWQIQNTMHSNIWDEIAKRHYADQISFDGADQKVLQFTRSLEFQYESVPFNNRVYFCLEERSLAQSLGLLNGAHKDVCSLAFSDVATQQIEFYTALQELYTDFPDTVATLESTTLFPAGKKKIFMAQTSISSEENTGSILFELQQMFRSHPWQAKTHEINHQSVRQLKFPLSSRNNKELLDDLSNFPSVIKAQSLVDPSTTLHFAPASLFILFETIACRNAGLGYLPTLFCPIVNGGARKISLLNNRFGVGNGRSLSNNLVVDGPFHRSKPKEQSFLKSELIWDGNEKSKIFMFHLNNSCMEALELWYGSMMNPSSVPKDDAWTCLRILPDDIRRLGVATSTNIPDNMNSNDNRGSSSNVGRLEINGGEKLNAAYALVADENSFGLSKSVDSSGNKIVQSVYYIIQLGRIRSNCEDDSLGVTQGDGLVDSSRHDDHGVEMNVITDSKIPMNLDSDFEHNLFYDIITSDLERHLVDDFTIKILQDHQNKSNLDGTCAAVIHPSIKVGITKHNDHYGDSSSVLLSPTRNKKQNSKSSHCNVLSNICHWRSCMCEASDPNLCASPFESSSNLCIYHSEMKKLLDSKAVKGTNLESSKYLPKKHFVNQPHISAQKPDLMIIRAASTLLQELWDGRLKSTVKLFAKKMISDIKFRSFLESQIAVFVKYHGQHLLKQKTKTHASFGKGKKSQNVNELGSLIMPIPPTWTLWKNRDYVER